jgi:hypothetical protein
VLGRGIAGAGIGAFADAADIHLTTPGVGALVRATLIFVTRFVTFGVVLIRLLQAAFLGDFGFLFAAGERQNQKGYGERASLEDREVGTNRAVSVHERLQFGSLRSRASEGGCGS